MYGFDNLDKIYKESDRILFDDSSNIVLMSDCHRGDGSWADNFFGNRNIYYSALQHYYKKEFTYIELGDGDELWENHEISKIIEVHKDIFNLLSQFYKEGRFYSLFGNHDADKKGEEFLEKNLYSYFDNRLNEEFPLFPNIKIPEGLVLQHRDTDDTIFLVHGHQVDFSNYNIYWIKKFLVRYFWRPLEIFGINDPTSPAQNFEKKKKVGEKLAKWSIKENQLIVAGHTHRSIFPRPGEPLYFNDGSCVHPRGITALEICKGAIALVKWHIKSKEDGTLFIGKDILAGPRRLKEYFNRDIDTEIRNKAY